MPWKLVFASLLVVAIIGRGRSQDFNINFEHADLTAVVANERGEVLLEAFKATHNDRVLHSQKTAQLSQLQWVSLGEPKLVRIADRRNPSRETVFDVKLDRVSVEISTLTEQHRQKLAETAQAKYQGNISDTQVMPIPLSYVDCRVMMLDGDGRPFLLTGSAGNLQVFPIHIDFIAPKKSPERQMFEHFEMKYSDELSVECTFSSKAKKARTNTFELSPKQIDQLGLVEKLFGSGDASQVFVTREQLVKLSYELYSALDVMEEYGLPRYQFSDAFVAGFLQQTMLSSFSDVSIDEALSTLSRYATDSKDELSAERISKDLGSVQWVTEGDRSVPKSITVAKLWRGNFNRTLRFRRILREVTESAFSRTSLMQTQTTRRVIAKQTRLPLQPEHDQQPAQDPQPEHDQQPAQDQQPTQAQQAEVSLSKLESDIARLTAKVDQQQQAQQQTLTEVRALQDLITRRC